MLGRVLTQADNLPNAQPVAVIGYNYWKTRLNSNPNVIGTIINVNATSMQIVGVMPQGATIPDVTSPQVDLWTPAALDPDARAENSHYLRVVARLAPGATVSSAQAELARFTQQLPDLFPTAYTAQFMRGSGFRTAVVPLRTRIIGDISTRLWVLLGAVALVLVIACGNVANLFLVRAEARQREVAIRTALGAKRTDLAWQYFTETLLARAPRRYCCPGARGDRAACDGRTRTAGPAEDERSTPGLVGSTFHCGYFDSIGDIVRRTCPNGCSNVRRSYDVA